MLNDPVFIPVNGHIFDLQDIPEMALVFDGYGKPHRSRLSVYLIPMSPPTLIELDIVVEYKHIGFANLIEVTTPWNVRRLQDDASHEFRL